MYHLSVNNNKGEAGELNRRFTVAEDLHTEETTNKHAVSSNAHALIANTANTLHSHVVEIRAIFSPC